ncbi:MAG: sigma 54-interacting transcriptional regulator [bacterium]
MPLRTNNSSKGYLEPQNNLQVKINQLEELMQLTRMLGQQTHFKDILRIVAEKAADWLRADLALILMLNPNTRQTVKTLYNKSREVAHRRYRLITTLVGGWIFKHEQSFFSTSIQKDKRFARGLFSDVPVTAVMGVPFSIEGATIGSLLLLYAERQESVAPASLELLENIAAVAVPFLRNVQKIKQFFQPALPDSTLLTKYAKHGLIGKSKRFIELLQAVEAAARCDVRVLLEGASGTGKELVARAIHAFSDRHAGAFVAIDCGAIPEHLMESELFGHVKGAFTGATYDRKGLFQEAHHGTLFIDEISNLPIGLQSKLMRVLQEGEIRPLGSNRGLKIDVRVISASSTSLWDLVHEKLFRDDLYYRLHVYPIYLPTLRERSEDIPLLANHFLQSIAAQQKKMVESFQEKLVDFLRMRSWAGNIRELENFVERLVTCAASEDLILEPNCLPADLKAEFEQLFGKQEAFVVTKSLNKQLSDSEERIIRDALIENNWNQSRAARSLKISEPVIRYRMKKLGIVRPYEAR